MTAGDKYAQALEQLFHRKPVATVDDLRRALDVKSRTTVLKALQTAGYLSSYTHAGQYYTLKRIPTFDAQGLWFYGNVRFSSHGTLRATVVCLVGHAPAGHTHDELQVCLGLRVQDTLRSLVQSKLIAREPVAALYVYVDTDPKVAAVQLARRRKRKGSPPPLDLARTIEVLVAVIHAPKDDAQAIAARLKVRGIEVSQEQVESIFAKYALKKTAPFRS
jgi:hypothetical protein